MNKLTVPVQIDSIKRLDEYQRARCIFYRVEVTEGFVFRSDRFLLSPSASFAAGVSWAVLAGPAPRDFRRKRLFLTRELIDQTMDAIQNDDRLFLEMGYIWLPNGMLAEGVEGTPIRDGDVYRMSMPFFRHCYLFVMGKISEEEWLSTSSEFTEAIHPSPQETIAFRAWRRAQIAVSHERYHRSDYANFRLSKKPEAK